MPAPRNLVKPRQVGGWGVGGGGWEIGFEFSGRDGSVLGLGVTLMGCLFLTGAAR